jgi:hypothetical protein
MILRVHSRQFASIRVKETVAEIVYGSEPVQGSEGVDGVLRRPSGPSARPEKRPENDRFYQTAECVSKNVGQASSLTVHLASLPRVSDGKMPPEPATRCLPHIFRQALRPELNFGKEKVKVLGGQPVENLKFRSGLVRFGPVWSSPSGRT